MTPILDVAGLRTHFNTPGGTVRAIDGVDLAIGAGETVAVVGESGSGKSVLGLSIMGLVAQPAGRIVAGSIRFAGAGAPPRDLVTLHPAAMRRIRGREIAMIFQDPMTSLDPLFTVGEQIAETLRHHEGMRRGQAAREAVRLLELVEIPAAARRAGEYPHQMSGGMRQRVMIALALACRPSLLIADEPTTALDVTIQAQILDLLRRLQAELGMAIMFVTHNLGIVADIAHRVVVMYAGRVLETAPMRELFRAPGHPYTRGLMSCVPRLGRGRLGERLMAIPGTVASPLAPPPGCAFAPRCDLTGADCVAGMPDLLPPAAGRQVRCLRWEGA
ncbi:MAG: ABC transporter ATP-binding protein [Alphaproteobacteria bacterium]|nr:ABC transporter ATP-binding protein [Alphaproteobacteria bacterium]